MGLMWTIRISDWFPSEQMQSIKQAVLGEEARKKMRSYTYQVMRQEDVLIELAAKV